MRLSGVRSLVLLLLFSVLAFAKAKEFVMPQASPAVTYPAHDQHTDEKLTIAADPYDMADKAKIFQINYAEGGYLPVFVVITNDGESPISIKNMQVELITHNRDKIQSASAEDLYRRFSHTKGDNANGKRIPLPIPSGPKVGVKKGQRDEISDSMFAAEAVGPHESQSGFLFFDVSGISHPLAGGRIIITGVNNYKGQELMYFEIPMEKYLSSPSEGSK
jgi:hypothetical protein